MEVYLDNAATTQMYDAVIERMKDVMSRHYGNPSSAHKLGDEARMIVEEVRSQIADDLACSPNEIIFTSGASEANTMAIYGAYLRDQNSKWIVSNIEHSSVNEIVKDKRFPIDTVDVDNRGLVSMADLCDKLTETKSDSIYVGIQYANNEIGTVQFVDAAAEYAHDYNGKFFTDATQYYPYHKINLRNIDMMSVSAHKFHGPKGIGFMYLDRKTKLHPVVHGTQNNGRRGGTIPVHLIAGMGTALEVKRSDQEVRNKTILRARNFMLQQLTTNISGLHPNGVLDSYGVRRLLNNINFWVEGVPASHIVTMCSLHGVYISAGSACHAHSTSPSHVLKAIGLSDEQVENSIRITLGDYISNDEIFYAVKVIKNVIDNYRAQNNIN